MRSQLLAILLLLSACKGSEEPGTGETSPSSSTDTDTGTPAPDPVLPGPGDLLIEELYYSGAVPQGGTDHYFSDQFVELVNTTELPLDVSGVMIGDAYGAAGAINPGMTPDSFVDERPDEVVLSSVWRIPVDTILPAGATMVIAHDGTNHRPFSTIDLSGATFETYVYSQRGNDTDHPTVPNMKREVFNGGYDWLVPVFGASIVVVEADAELGEVPGPYGTLASIDASKVLDGVEALMDADSGAFHRLPDGIDTGFGTVSEPYVGLSLHRKRSGEGWQDTNDSSADFEVGEPDPGEPPLSDGVFGDPWVELGTGIEDFVSLDDGDPLELVAGIQGGWHLDTALRFDGFGPNGIVLVYDAVSTGGEVVSYVTSTTLVEQALVEEDEGWSRLGDRVVLDIASPADVVGSELILRVTAELDGQTWSDERRVVVVDEE